jgi:hypothetical protein
VCQSEVSRGRELRGYDMTGSRGVRGGRIRGLRSCRGPRQHPRVGSDTKSPATTNIIHYGADAALAALNQLPPRLPSWSLVLNNTEH